VLIVYGLANLALPFYYRTHLPDAFRAVRHVILPVLGIAMIGVPIYYLTKPGSPPPMTGSPTRPWPSSWRR
jgi:amino acid transporter